LKDPVEDERVAGIDPNVWRRLPFWVRELLKMLGK
jgi:hypothetical protein